MKPKETYDFAGKYGSSDKQDKLLRTSRMSI